LCFVQTGTKAEIRKKEKPTPPEGGNVAILLKKKTKRRKGERCPYPKRLFVSAGLGSAESAKFWKKLAPGKGRKHEKTLNRSMQQTSGRGTTNFRFVSEKLSAVATPGPGRRGKGERTNSTAQEDREG